MKEFCSHTFFFSNIFCCISSIFWSPAVTLACLYCVEYFLVCENANFPKTHCLRTDTQGEIPILWPFEDPGELPFELVCSSEGLPPSNVCALSQPSVSRRSRVTFTVDDNGCLLAASTICRFSSSVVHLGRPLLGFAGTATTSSHDQDLNIPQVSSYNENNYISPLFC